MKCPFCNADMKDEQVFCESCGKEIHLVPLFDPSVELTIEQSLSGIAGDVGEKEFDETDKASEEEEVSNSFFKKHRFPLAISIVILLVLIICAIVVVPTMVNPERYYEDAMNSYKIGNETKAYNLAMKALEKQLPVEKQFDLALMLATIDEKNEIYDSAASYYKQCIALKPEQVEPYEALVGLLERTKDYPQLSNLLSLCDNAELKTKYAKYLANQPTFDTESGNYNEVIYLKILTEGEGQIHYTINGDKPTKESDVYVLPLKLETGTFHVEAVFINQYGVESDVAAVDLKIEVASLDGPEISLESGTYHEPQVIDVFMPDDSYAVYYTVDGDDPDLSSIKYEKTLLLPFGEHTYRFIMYDADGVASDIEERTYQLTLSEAAFDPEAARYMLLQNLIMRGILLDAEGHSAVNAEVRQYLCDTAFESEGQFFYLFVERTYDSAGGSSSTGMLYGVQIKTGEVYKVTCDDSGLYFVQPF